MPDDLWWLLKLLSELRTRPVLSRWSCKRRWRRRRWCGWGHHFQIKSNIRLKWMGDAWMTFTFVAKRQRVLQIPRHRSTAWKIEDVFQLNWIRRYADTLWVPHSSYLSLTIFENKEKTNITNSSHACPAFMPPQSPLLLLFNAHSTVIYFFKKRRKNKIEYGTGCPSMWFAVCTS